MKKVLLSTMLVLALVPLFCSQSELPARYREWLEDVSPIITRTEQEIFSKLKTDADREKFISFFWRQRDPSPDTAENEFYKEYMERVRYADQNFGRESSKRGSQTERGYFYLLLGKPLERQLFTTMSQIWPVELWYYQGAVEFGLPPYFYLVFYQPEGIGDYRLYSPGVEGPEAGPFTSTSIIASIHAVPEKKFSDAYARNYLTYKDYVETEYSDNFIDSSFACGVFRP